MDKTEWIALVIVGFAFFFSIKIFLAKRKKQSCCPKGCSPLPEESNKKSKIVLTKSITDKQ